MGELPDQQSDWPTEEYVNYDSGTELKAAEVVQQLADPSRGDAPAKSSAAKEIHPLESILVAMSVKRQQHERRVAIDRSILPIAEGTEDPDLPASSPLLRDRYLAIIAATTKELNSTQV
jgi:hypothetical protein